MTEEGPFTPTLTISNEIGNCGPRCLESRYYVKGLEDGQTFLQDCVITPGIPFDCLQHGPGIVRVYSPQSVEFVPRDATLEDWNGGKRIFPGKVTPTDTKMRDVMEVKVVTTGELPGTTAPVVETATVSFRAVDMDDPTSDQAPIDPMGDMGDDNRGVPKPGQLTGQTVGQQINADGEATVTFQVTKNPGDNFRVVAGCDDEYLLGKPADPDPKGVRGKGPNVVDAQGDNIEVTERAKGSMTLTVWRKLHIEWDEMGVVEGNQVTGVIQGVSSGTQFSTIRIDTRIKDTDRFQGGQLHAGLESLAVLGNKGKDVFVNGPVDETQLLNQPYLLVDDDDFNSNQSGNLDGDALEKVTQLSNSRDFLVGTGNVLEPAFIEPVFDGGGGNNDDVNLPFELNIKSDHPGKLITALGPSTGRGSAGNGTDDFWVAYFRSAYQSVLKKDNDEDGEGAAAGITPGSNNTAIWTEPSDVQPGGEAILIFHEGEKELLRDAPLIHAIVPPHELGHALGLGHDTDLMSENPTLPGTNLHFSDKHLNNIRWRVHSPGKLQ